MPTSRIHVVLARWAAPFALLTSACSRIPEGRTTVNEVQVRGTDKLAESAVEEKIATTETPKFLGLFRGVLYDYSVFDPNVLQRDLVRIEAFYRSKGYYDAHARAGRIHTIDDAHVRVEIIVEEGPPVIVRNIQIEGLEGVPKDVVRVAERDVRATLAKGEPFDEEAFDKTIGALRRALSDRGYAYATVTNNASIDIVHHTADVVLEVRPGPRCTIGEVTIEGLDPLPEGPIRRAFAVRSGQPYSEVALGNGQQALLELGVFASVDVVPDLSDPSRDVVPVRVKVEPSRLRTIKLGGGIEFDALKADMHGLVGWEHHNFLGGLRRLSVTFRPGLVFYPIRINNFTGPTDYLPEERLRFELRQPGFVEAHTNGFIRPEFNVQALLLKTDPEPGAPVVGFAETRNALGVDRPFGHSLFAGVSHNLQAAYPFVYLGERDPTLGTLLISYPELLVNLDLRDDRVHPRKGVFIANTFQAAGGPFLGQAQDIKLQPDVRAYVPLHRRVVFAVRGSVGLLFPRNYGDVVRNPTSNAPPSEARTRDFQLTFFRGFFSGGPASNRGYPLRAVGPHDFVPFLSSDIAAEAAAINCKSEEDLKRSECKDFAGYDFRSPTGGFTLWEGSAELRVAIAGPLSAATFCDASDVSPQTADIRLTHLHLSCGAGARYDTPVGPVRVDIGYRIPGLQVIGGLTPDERKPSDLLDVLPIAIHLGIGEAY